MNNSNPFPLLHVALYAKGWYKKSNNVFEDLKIILTLDGYSGDLFKEKDIASILLNDCQNYLSANRAFNDLFNFANGISKEECWKYGYHHNGHTWINKHEELKDYNMNEAIVRYCLCNLTMIETKAFGIEKFPELELEKFPSLNKNL